MKHPGLDQMHKSIFAREPDNRSHLLFGVLRFTAKLMD
jgi:hypothetical protein